MRISGTNGVFSEELVLKWKDDILSKAFAELYSLGILKKFKYALRKDIFSRKVIVRKSVQKLADTHFPKFNGFKTVLSGKLVDQFLHL